MSRPNVETATLKRQSYGMASGGGKVYGGPRGVWLECTSCDDSHVIAGSRSDEWQDMPDAEAAKVFRRHGWTGEGDRMLKAKCPTCSAKLGGVK